MVLFVDLDDDPEPPEVKIKKEFHIPTKHLDWRHLADSPTADHEAVVGRGHELRPGNAPVLTPVNESVRPNPNRNTMTEALGCYPVISEIVSHIDLNTLDNLAQTCRQVRENLLQFRTRLIRHTLRCSNEDVSPDPEQTLRYRARMVDWYFAEQGARAQSPVKLGSCARDMVRDCRRCGRIVCRNCTIKPPAPILLKTRHRRICRTCTKSPLVPLVTPHLPSTLPCTDEVVKRAVCLCEEDGVWLCQPCGQGLRSADQTYESIWRWRTAYGPSLGGLGVGIGEGNRGVSCGREAECLAAREVEEEIDCDAADARQIEAAAAAASLSSREGSASPSSSFSSSSSPYSASGIQLATSPGSMGPGYSRHEIEGIGGVVKTKLVRMVKIGASVMEFADEMEPGAYLRREKNGTARSWCGWCWRVIPGAKDRAGDTAAAEKSIWYGSADR